MTIDNKDVITVNAVKAEAVEPSAPPSFGSNNEESHSPSSPPGMLTKTITINYPDGRQITTTEFIPESSASASVLPPELVGSSVTRSVAAEVPPVRMRKDLGTKTVSVTCPHCDQRSSTKVVREYGTCTWVTFTLLLLFFFPLFWLPFVCHDCQDTKHYCQHCGRKVGFTDAECCKK
mmetsp:Transcript_28932/g.60943  ORF Transcript_28932/g.60943 Transcript_28932/m.60943 type:complete len:177 (-) Transcript_28932:255-785(-)